ncbi:extracellular solute-binding protein [Pseudohalocynthiibacter aestuariivivens]|jgi:putative spermidine/putrescine transport system substrate-binding protein|uniref:Extracellular solute-binding protein n=1 Tax=Pseudohalocynthiibacter aestuariivivens TaxID=1591409 RepID=A0ABV5JAQ4_9RHOB|nr:MULTISPECIES: extracellular solute-binding protein [Pseudohalocynthiibacter]MBS9715907.1 extracellular solute-binding protein [Pseudohalocynthiibacter aestuariivivens]MCK0101520.1 extracellular solute-binding protein [Pseudohalocynthiibacter sp. F2068]
MNLYRNSFSGGRKAVLAALFLTVPLSNAWAQEAPDSDATVAVAAPEITFTSWTGPYMRSQMLGFVRPYEEASGSRVNVEHYNGGIAEIRDQVESANVIWDVVDLTQADSLRACNEGLLENLSGIDLPAGADGTPASDDFLEGALNDCGVGVIVWATAFAHSKTAFPENPPTSIADFFDTDTYPGARAIRNDPTVIMEWALMADGVAREDVYSTLETEDGVSRALKKMDAIKSGLEIWVSGREPVRLLNSGEVAMSSIWATTGAVASQEENADFAINWDGRVIELDLFGIPKGSRYKEEAIEFIRYASSSESLANMVSHLPNGPTRTSSLALLSDEILGQIPNGPAYEDNVHIMSDAEWWARNHARLEEAFRAWLSTSARQGAAGSTR